MYSSIWFLNANHLLRKNFIFAGHGRNAHEQTDLVLLPFNRQSAEREQLSTAREGFCRGTCRELWNFVSERPNWDLGSEEGIPGEGIF